MIESGDNGGIGPRVLRVPEGDSRPRHTCPDCGFIHYRNPLIVVGSVCLAGDGRLLLCRRAIAPRVGYWTIPAGYMELEESTEDSARHEAIEEANANIIIEHLLAIYNIPRISQVQILYAARLTNDAVSPGPESQAVDLFEWEDIPWSNLAFPSVHWALTHHRQAVETGDWTPRSAPAP